MADLDDRTASRLTKLIYHAQMITKPRNYITLLCKLHVEF